MRSQAQPLQVGGGNVEGFLPGEKGLVMQLGGGGKNQTKQLLFPSGSEWGVDVKVELSLPKDYGNVFSFLFLRDGGSVCMLFC